MKFSSSKGHIGAASSVGVLVFIMTTICALGIFYVLRERRAPTQRRQEEKVLDPVQAQMAKLKAQE